MASFSNVLALIASLGGLKRIYAGDEEIGTAGSVTDLDTGLTTIDAAFATVKGTQGGTENALCYTVDFGTDDGLVDIYTFDVAGVAATTDTVTVMIVAIGE